MKKWTSLAAFLLILLFADAADGLMDVLGMPCFMVFGLVVLAGARLLLEAEPREETEAGDQE